MINTNYQLEKYYVFIDTSVFRTRNFQFDSDIFRSIISHARLGYLCPIITEVTISEIEKLMEETVIKAFDALSKHYVLKNISEFNPLFNEQQKISQLENLKTRFQRFLDDASFQKISVDLAKPSEIFDRYFKKQPPFSLYKPAEFADAFILTALLKYSNNINEKIYIISHDADMDKFCEGNNQLEYYPSLESFLNFVMEQADPSRIQYIQEYITKHSDIIYDPLFEKIRYLNFDLYLFSYLYRGHITAIEDRELDINEINIIDYQKESCVVELSVRASILLYITGVKPSYYSSYQDTAAVIPKSRDIYEKSKSKEYINFTYDKDIDLLVNLQLIINDNKIQIVNIIINDETIPKDIQLDINYINSI